MTEHPFRPGFKNLDRDIDRYLDRFGTWDRSGPTPVVRGYDKAVRTVFDMYLQNRAYDAIVSYLAGSWNYEHGLNEYFLEASQCLKRDRQANRLKRLWRSVIVVQKQYFWELRTHGGTLQMEESVAEAKENVLSTMGLFRNILTELDDQDELNRLDGEIDAVRAERRPRLPGKADSRKIDGEIFWSVVEQAKRSSAGVTDQVSSVTDQLEAFNASQIKRFQTLLEARLDEANHWDLWALAFVAQDGCSDDAFEGFRAWLVLQGRRLFELALHDIRAVFDEVPTGPQTSAEALLMAAPVAFATRAGKAMKIARRSTSRLKGQPWDENELSRRYPELVRYYDGQRSP